MLEKMKKPAFWLGILGVIKLASDTMGYKFIEDSQINSIADGIATVFTVMGVIISHDKVKAN